MKDTEKKKVMDVLDCFVDKVLAYNPKRKEICKGKAACVDTKKVKAGAKSKGDE